MTDFDELLAGLTDEERAYLREPFPQRLHPTFTKTYGPHLSAVARGLLQEFPVKPHVVRVKPTPLGARVRKAVKQLHAALHARDGLVLP